MLTEKEADPELDVTIQTRRFLCDKRNQKFLKTFQMNNGNSGAFV